MSPAEFDDRLNALLDARRDPLDDPPCCAYLAEHPEALEAFAAQRGCLAALPDLVPPVQAPARWRRRAPWLLLAAVAAAAALLAWPAAPAAAAAGVPRGRVLAASLEPIRPRLGASGTACARTVLLDRPDARLETYVQWSAP